MAIRGTENYVYYMDKRLGSGATGVVYFGRHKRKGTECAVKIFSKYMGRETGQNITRNELEWLRQLKHRNIVSLLSIETDLRSREVALVLEYCSYGSLDRLIRQPKNLNGLPEEQFLNFLYQFSDGLRYLRMHGITHRDIKPSNILCTKMEDGSIWYKITDFGVSKDLCSDKPSVFGTEEYLHPEIFKCIIIDKKSVPVEMELRSELWSIGVTLYEVATGKQPFVVPGGRKNKLKMYTLISEKIKGYISGRVDERSSQIEYSECLPPTCWLSKSLRNFLERLLRGLIEKDHDSQMPFDEFFPAIDSLRSLQPIKVFDVSSMVICKVYFDRCAKFSKFKEEVSHITGINEVKQFYIIRRNKLEINDDDLFYLTRPDIKDETLVLLSIESKFPILKHPYIGNYSKPSDKFDDYLWSLTVSGWCSQVHMHIIDLTQKQVLLSDLSCKINNILEAISTKIAWILKNFDAKLHLKTATNIASRFQKKYKNSFSIMTPFSPECLTSKCSTKAETVYNQAVEVHRQFCVDKNKSLNHNEEQIHKYNRSKLEEKLKYLQEVYKSCEKRTETMHDKFRQWYSSGIVKLLEISQEMEDALLAPLNLESEGLSRTLQQNDKLITELEALVNTRAVEIGRIIHKQCS